MAATPATPRVEIRLSPGRQDGTYRAEVLFRADPQGRDSDLLAGQGPRVIHLERERLQAAEPDAAEPDAAGYGQELGRSLLDESGIAGALKTALGYARNGELRLQLTITPDAGELHALRWESLAQTPDSGFLAQVPNIHFSRYVVPAPGADSSPRPLDQLSVALLVAVATDPEKYQLAPLSAERSARQLRDAFGESVQVFQGGADAPVTRDTLRARLAEADIVHLEAHGRLVDGEPALYLQREDGMADPLRGKELLAWVRRASSRPALLVLAASYSAALGPDLVRAGIPAVIGVQDNIRINTVERFFGSFYAGLARHGVVDQAIGEARRAAAEAPDWWMPVLFTSRTDGLLFEDRGTTVSVGDIAGRDLVKQQVSSPYNEVQFTPPVTAGPSDEELLRRINGLAGVVEADEELRTIGAPFAAQIQQRLGLARAGLESRDPAATEKFAGEAQALFDRWHSERRAWASQLRRLEELRRTVAPQDRGVVPPSEFDRQLATVLDELAGDVPYLESAAALRAELDRLEAQRQNYQTLTRPAREIQDQLGAIRPASAALEQRRSTLQRDLAALLAQIDRTAAPARDQTHGPDVYSRLEASLMELRAASAQLAEEMQAEPVLDGGEPGDAGGGGVHDPLGARPLQGEIERLRSAGAGLAAPLAAPLDVLLGRAEQAEAAGLAGDAAGELEKARALVERWSAAPGAWEAELAQITTLRAELAAAGERGSTPHLQAIGAGLAQVEGALEMFKAPTALAAALGPLAGYLKGYRELAAVLGAQGDRLRGLRERAVAPADREQARELSDQLARQERSFGALRPLADPNYPGQISLLDQQLRGLIRSADALEQAIEARAADPADEAAEDGQPAGRGEPASPATQIVQNITVAPLPAPPEQVVEVDLDDDQVRLRFAGDPNPYGSKTTLDHARLAGRENLSLAEYGRLLYEGIFNDVDDAGFEARPTSVGYQRARPDPAAPVGIALRIAPGSRAAGYSWESMSDPRSGAPIAIGERSPIYRLHGGMQHRLVPARPLKVAVAISNPRTLGPPTRGPLGSLEPLKVELEAEIVRAALAPLLQQPNGQPLAELTVIGGDEGPVTVDALSAAIQGGCNVLHLLAHGGFFVERGSTPDKAEYKLVLEDERRAHRLVGAAELAVLEPLIRGSSLSLVVLGACQSGNLNRERAGEHGTAMRALAPTLVERGVAAVIAMQEDMPIEAAQLFAARFYGDLARTGDIARALAATRHDLYLRYSASSTWSIPALFTANVDTRLFDVDAQRADAIPRPAAGALPVRSYRELGGAGDLRAERLAAALNKQVLDHGFGDDGATLARVQALAAQLATTARAPGTPQRAFAARQDRDALTAKLAPAVAFKQGELEQHVRGSSGIELSEIAYAQITAALNAGKHIILIGPPGTGKTSLARDICTFAMAQQPRPYTGGLVLATATADWTTFDTVGGYVPARDQTLQFRPGIMLQAVASASWLVIDEINRADIDKAFGELFTLLSGQEVTLPYMVDEEFVRIRPPSERPAAAGGGWAPEDAGPYDYVMHPCWRIIGTMNVYDKSSLYAMSFAFMRRFAFIDVEAPDNERIFFRLVDRWLARRGLALPYDKASWPAPDASHMIYQRLFRELLKRDSELMRRRTLGPAIVEDMIAYLGDRNPSPAGTTPDELRAFSLRYLAEAFLLYVAPQLDGLDYDSILAIYREVFTFYAMPWRENSILTRLRLLYPHIKDEEWELVVRQSDDSAG